MDSDSLDAVRKSAISRRGGVRVRGGRLPPIRIRNAVPTTTTKKVVAPKIPQRRNKIKEESQELFESKPKFSEDGKKDNRKPFGRGRGQRVYIQTEGSFLGQGPAFRHKKETAESHYERIPRSSSRIKVEMNTKINAAQINLLLEGYDDKDAYLDDENNDQPVWFPLRKTEFKASIKEEMLDNEDAGMSHPKIKKEEIEGNDNVDKFLSNIKKELLSDDEDATLKIKKEPEDDADETKLNLTLSDVKTIKQEMPEPKLSNLLAAMKLSQEEDVFFLFQLPSCLPLKRCDESSDQPTKKDRSSTAQGDKGENLQDEAKGASFKDIPEGAIGKLQIMKSGRMRLALGSVDIALESGMNQGSTSEVVSIPIANGDKGDCIVLGEIHQKMIMYPILTDPGKDMKDEETFCY